MSGSSAQKISVQNNHGKAAVKPARKPKCFYSAHAWQCRHLPGRSEILAYVEASGAWECVAEIHPTSGFSAETIAAHICGLVNDHQRDRPLLLEAMDALELCLESEHLTFSSEQMAEKIVERLGAVV